MLVKNITNIKYFTDQFEPIDKIFVYSVNYHPEAPQTKFETNPTFVASFDNCLVHSLPFLVTEDQHLITNHVWPLLDKVRNKPYKTHGLWKTWGKTVDIDLQPVSKSFTEEGVYVWLPIDEQSAENPWHIWIDVISKFRLLELSNEKLLSKYVFVLSNKSKYFDRVAKELFPQVKYYVMESNTVWRFKNLIVPSMSNHSDGVIVPTMADWIYRRFSKRIERPHRKILVSRDDAPARKISNAEEMFIALKGWESITLSAMTIQEQITAFAEASHVISPHGAGLLNTVFSQRGTRVIEIAQKELLSKKPYPILSFLRGHDHTFVLADTIPLGTKKPAGVKRLKDYNNYKIDISEIIKLL